MRNSALFTLLISILITFSCKDDVEKIIDVSSKSDKENGIQKKSFYKNGRLDKTLEYVKVCEKKYLNQGWYFNDKGDTLTEKGNHYNIQIGKNILKPLEETKISMFYKPLLKNTVTGIILCRENNIDYCELETKKSDMIYFINNKLEFILSFRNKGKVKVTGYALEVSKKTQKVKGGNAHQERRVYFTLNFTVK